MTTRRMVAANRFSAEDAVAIQFVPVPLQDKRRATGLQDGHNLLARALGSPIANTRVASCN